MTFLATSISHSLSILKIAFWPRLLTSLTKINLTFCIWILTRKVNFSGKKWSFVVLGFHFCNLATLLLMNVVVSKTRKNGKKQKISLFFDCLFSLSNNIKGMLSLHWYNCRPKGLDINETEKKRRLTRAIRGAEL